MNNLFKLAQVKGKWHKFPSFNLGGGAKLYKNFAQKLLAVSLCMAVVLMAVPLGGRSVHVAAAAGEPTKMTSPITVPEVNLDATGTDITKWKKNGDVYETQNQSSNSMACTMDVPVEVTAGYAELEFEWKVSSEAGYDFLRFELKDADTGDVLQSNHKSGEETAFDKFVLKLDKGTYTLTFTYQGDSSGSSGTDTGYVKSLNLVTYSGVSAISKTMFAEPDDLTNSDNFSLATADYSKVGKISFGTRPGEVKYYKRDWTTPYSVGTAGTPTPITWLIAGSDADNGLVLYSEEPLIGCDSLTGETNTSVFQVDDDNKTYTAPANSGYGPDGGAQTVYANHLGASNLRKVLNAIYNGSTLGEGAEAADYAGFFKATEKGLMSVSEIKTHDHQTGSAVEYTTTDYLYAPRYNSNQALNSWENDDKITVGGSDSLTIDIAHWGGFSWLRSPYPDYSNDALVALPGNYVSNYGVTNDNSSISAAFRLDLSSVLFTSAASAASSAEGGSFEAISAGTPMTLRLDGSDQDLGSATLSLDKSAVSLAGANGSTLMVQGVTDDGQNWSYSKAIESDSFTTVSAAEVAAAGATGLTSFDNCEVWLEKPVDSSVTLTYAVRAEETLPGVPVTGVSLSETAKSLAVGESFDLTATVSPEDATNKNVTWTSSETSVATVAENGTVKALKVGTTTITVTTADGAKTATCEVTVTEAAGTPPPATTPDSTPDTTPDTPPDAPPADTPDTSAYLEATVDVKGQQQRLRVYDPNGVLPEGTTLSAEAVTAHEHLDDDHEIEHLLSYTISLLDANGDALPMPLSGTVELCFEVLDGLDKDELEVVLVKEFDDAEFEENLVDLDGASWVKVKTNHFSPYALIDELSEAEKAALGNGKNNVKTGDHAVQVAVAGLGSILVLALGIILRLITSKKKFE